MSRRTSSHEPLKDVPSRVTPGSAAASSSGSYLKDGLSDPDIGPLIVANGDPRSIEALAATSRGTRDIAESVKRERAEFCWPNKESCTTPKQDCSIKCDSVASFQSSMIELCENGCVDVSLYDAEHPWEDHVSRSSMRQIFRCTKTFRHIHSSVALLRHAIASGALAQCRELYLGGNEIGDDGLKALSTALAGGALVSLKNLYLHANDFSDTAKEKLKAACKPRGITGAGF